MSIEIKISNKPIPYKSAINFLEKRVKAIKNGKESDLFWVLEHPTVYTSGIRGSKSEILDKKIKIVHTNRGGKITLHSKGQKIVYFAINLNNKKKDVRKFISMIEDGIIELLKIYNIKSKVDRKNIGIWVNDKKIAAIGIRISKWIAYHGLSINVNNNLKLYDKIIPCGLDNKKITSIVEETGSVPKNLNNKLIEIFKKKISTF
tara:strand:+ start:1272 stop:1883 length:612 start_codon:yes stop_codon:yes gene_type:complete